MTARRAVPPPERAVGPVSESRLAVVDASGVSTDGVSTDSVSMKVAEPAPHSVAPGRPLDLEAHLASIGRVSAGLTHELRSPLCVIRLGLETLGEHLAGQAARGDAVTALAEVSDAVGRIEGLLAAMRGLVRAQRGAARRFDLVALARSVQRVVAGAFRNVAFEVVAPPELQVTCDELRLRQIAENLASNAAQAAASAAQPYVRLHVYASRDAAVLSVRDNGPGIAPEDQEKIFEAFYTTRRESGGTGLGLALCREYALQMGVDLSVASATGRGACFRATIPR